MSSDKQLLPNMITLMTPIGAISGNGVEPNVLACPHVALESRAGSLDNAGVQTSQPRLVELRPMKTANRREFLKTSMTAATAFAILPGGKAAGPNDRVILGVMGTGGRGSYLAGAFAQRKDAEVAYVCDADTRRMAQAQKNVAALQNKQPKAVQDFRRMLEDRSVDAIINATPDHWHALGTILACQAGKDVYVEKPLCHTPWEGRKMIEAARNNQAAWSNWARKTAAPTKPGRRPNTSAPASWARCI